MHKVASEQRIVTIDVSLFPKTNTAWNRPATREFTLAGPIYGSVFVLCCLIFQCFEGQLKEIFLLSDTIERYWIVLKIQRRLFIKFQKRNLGKVQAGFVAHGGEKMDVIYKNTV